MDDESKTLPELVHNDLGYLHEPLNRRHNQANEHLGLCAIFRRCARGDDLANPLE